MSWHPPTHDRSRELREHLDAAGWRAAVLAIAQRHGLATDALAPFAGGSDIVWSAGEHVVKLTAPVWSEEIEAEARWLAHVHGRLPVESPEPVAAGELAGWPYVVMRRVRGAALGELWPRLARPERQRLAAELGRLARALHELPVPPGPDGWDAFWRSCRADVAARHARGEVPRELLEEVEPFLARVGPLESDARAVLHTELLDQHVLVEERAGRVELAALIDFADGRVGPPEYEHAAPVEFVFRGERGLLRAYLEAWGEPAERLGPERSERLIAWALCHRFGSLARMLRAVAPWRPASLAELGRRLYGV